MKTSTTVSLLCLCLCLVAPITRAESLTTVVEDVTIETVTPGGELLLEDGRRVMLRRSPADPRLLKNRSIRVIGSVDPRGSRGLQMVDIIRAPRLPQSTFFKSSEEIDLEGAVTAVEASFFDLAASEGDFRVDVDESTEFEDLEAFADLAIGNTVRVKGELHGQAVEAETVRLLAEGDEEDDPTDGGNESDDEEDGTGNEESEDDDEEDDEDDGDDDEEEDDEEPTGVVFESLGQITDLADGTHLRLTDSRLYETNAATEYSDGVSEYADLQLGMTIHIKASHETSGTNLALEIALESEEDGTTEVDGVVESVDPTGFFLENGPRFEVVASTVFDGDADRLADLEPGWFVEVSAYQVGGGLRALEVDADDPGVATIEGEEFEPQEALVVLAAGADSAIVAARYGATVIGTIGDVAVLFWWEEDIDQELLEQMNADTDVAAVEPNYLFRDPESVRRRYVVVDRQPTDSKFNDQIAAAMTNVKASRLVSDGAGSVVAVLDTGIDPEHPALVGRFLTGGLDLVDGDTEPWEQRDGFDQDGDGDIDEGAGHGTFVSSLVLLVAPAAKILPYRVLDDDGGGSAYLLSLALADALERSVDVISLSLVYHRRSAAVDLLLEQAGARGIAVVAAAGNEGEEVLPFPASDRHTLAVTGMNTEGTGLADFSNRGAEVFLAAPSESVYGAIDGDRWGTWSGTSMGVPFVAGTLALLRLIDPAIDPALFAELLTQTGFVLTDGAWTGIGLDVGAAIRQMTPMVEHRPPGSTQAQ